MLRNFKVAMLYKQANKSGGKLKRSAPSQPARRK